MKTARTTLIVACLALGALCGSATAAITLTNSGAWSNSANWNGPVPAAGNAVNISDGAGAGGFTVTIAGGTQSFGDSTGTEISTFYFNDTIDGTGGGTLNHVAGSTFRVDFSGNKMLNLIFNNSGVYLQTLDQVLITGSTFNNLATGVIRGAGRIRGGTVNNLGTMEVTLGGTLDFDNSPQTTMLSISNGGADLDTGTYRIFGHGLASDMTFRGALVNGGGTVAVGEIVHINSGATVELSTTGAGTAIFDELGAVSSVAGKFMLYGTKSHTLSAGATAVSGTVGGDGTFVAPGGLSLAGGSIDVEPVAGGYGTLDVTGVVTFDAASSLLMDIDASLNLKDSLNVAGNVFLDGTLNLGYVSGNITTFDLIQTSGGGTISGLFDTVLLNNAAVLVTQELINSDQTFRITIIPEPSTMLLLLGAGVLVWRRGSR